MTDVEYKWNIEPTEDTPYLNVTGEPWGVFCDDFGENWCYNRATWYAVSFVSMV